MWTVDPGNFPDTSVHYGVIYSKGLMEHCDGDQCQKCVAVHDFEIDIMAQRKKLHLEMLASCMGLIIYIRWTMALTSVYSSMATILSFAPNIDG